MPTKQQPLSEAAKRRKALALRDRGWSLKSIQASLHVRRPWLLAALGLPPDPPPERPAPPSFEGVPSLPSDLANRMGDSCSPLSEEQEAAADRAIAAAMDELRKRQQANPAKQPAAEIPRVKLVVGTVRGGVVSL